MIYAYLRQSSTEGDRSVSCEQQLENINNYAKENGWTIKQSFEDKNVSGRLYPPQFTSLAEADLVYKQYLKETKKEGQWRTGLGKLFDKLKDGDTIIVDDLTRFYRPLTNSYLESALTQFLLSKQIRLITVKNGEVKLSSFNDNLINALQNRINDNQLTIQRQKSKASIARLYNAGELKQGLGQMIGYKPTGKKKEVEVDEVGAKIVKYIFKSYIEGKSLLQIVRDLNKNFNMKSCVKSIKNIIERPLYCGYMYDKQNNLIKAQQVQGKEIIDFNTWTTAKKIMDSRKTNNIKIKQYPLHWTGLCKCGICGSKMSVCINQQGKYFSFRCMSHTIRSKENCKISITANTLYNKGLSLDDAIYPILILGLLKKLENSNNISAKDQLEEKKIILTNIINAEQKMTEMFLNGLLDSKVYEQNLKKQQDKKKQVQQEIIQLEQDLAEDDSEKIRLLVNKIVGRALSFQQYQELIPLTIKDIIVYKERITVQTYYGDIDLPRMKSRGILVLPEYKWRNTGEEFKIYYHFNNFNIYNKQVKLFTYNNTTIYMEDQQ
ncbi:MAG: recombinase family protein [Methanobrevibacter sp.]|nr:recombinase family protein [Methanobrevibacter sp.]MBO7717094.1 recombinase family protein [Methanobrevibacter sp.]